MPPRTINSGPDRREILRGMLTRRRDELYQRIAEFRREQEQEAEPPPADSIEAARATADIETHAGLIDRNEDELRRLDAALERVEQGSYGMCADCGHEIPLDRLTAIPFALCCVNCQDKRNHARRRSSEGATIPPYDHQWLLPEEMREPKEYRVETNVAGPTPPHVETWREAAGETATTATAKPEQKRPEQKRRPRPHRRPR